MLWNKRSRLFLIAGSLACALMLLPAAALADTVTNSVGANATVPVAAGDTVTVNYRLVQRNHDGQKHCNASPQNPAILTISAPGVSVTPADKKLTFTNCKQTRQATFSATSQGGPWPVTVAVAPNGPGAYDVAGATFKLLILPPPDPEAPTLQVHFPAANGSNGWYVSRPVVGTVTATDPSAVASIDCVGATVANLVDLNPTTTSADLMVDVEGASYVSCQATDKAAPPHTGVAPGSTYAASVLIDTAPPTINPDFDRDPDSNGWYNQGVTVDFLGDDDSSGVDLCTDPVLYTGPDQASATLWGTCSDLAGNAAAQTAAVFKYDATPPTHVAGTPDRPADFQGGYRRAVTITFDGADATSGAAPGSLSCTKVIYTGPASPRATVSGTCTDPAGNTSAAASFSFKFFATLQLPYLHR